MKQSDIDDITNSVRREIGDYDEAAVMQAIKSRVEQVAQALFENGGPGGGTMSEYPEFGIVKIGHGRYTIVPKNVAAGRVKWKY